MCQNRFFELCVPSGVLFRRGKMDALARIAEAAPSEAGALSESGTMYTSASRAIDQAWGGTDWSSVLRSLAVPSADDGTPQVRTP
jgi:hypothetical protein